MAHGQPDYGAYAAKEAVVGLADMGELAARLGSIVTHDRRGDVIMLDDFENGIAKWKPVLLGDDAAAEWTAETARDGGFSVKLTGSWEDPNFARLERGLAYPYLSRMGCEIAFAIDDRADYVLLETILYAEGVRRWFSLQYNEIDESLQCVGALGAPQVFATEVDLYHSMYTFHVMKLVFDASTGRYVRAILNNTAYDLSEYSGYITENSYTPRLFLRIEAAALPAAEAIVYCDNYILTQNEP